MLTRRSLFLVAILAMTLPQRGQDLGCGTSVDTSLYVSAMHAANTPRATRARTAAISAPVSLRDGIFVVGKTPQNSLVEHPNDLEGKSVRFVPAGDRYRATVQDLQYDTNIGSLVRAFTDTSGSNAYARVTLKNVKLPLFGQSVDSFYVTAFNSITLTPPQQAVAVQYDTLEAAVVREPTIAPLLMGSSRIYTLDLPSVYVREAPDGVTVTWRPGGRFSYDVQARITSAGEITFSYRNLGGNTWGAAVITPGIGGFLQQLKTVAQVTDASDDVSTDVPSSARGPLDIRSVTLQQIPGVGACLLVIDTGGNPDAMFPPRGDTEIIKVTFGDAPPLTMTLNWNGGVTVIEPGRVPSPSASGVGGNQLQMTFFVDGLRPIASPAHMVIETSLLSMSSTADRLVADVALNDGEVPGTELSAAHNAELRLPIVDAFTWPTTDLQSVWESVRSSAALDDAQIDGVVIFEDFHTEVTIANIAYASIGNPQVDGVWKYAAHNASSPRVPNLMNLNDVTFTSLAALDVGRIVLHEFGHRWLQFVETMDNGTPALTLNPAPAHPPQFASTPAAFPVVHAYDTSTMGGGSFTQAGNRFTSANASPYGYSWLDLYLMGLAAPEEVPPMYVIDHADPPLGYAYAPPSNITVTGTRHDVTIQQVIDAMGPRRPSASASQKKFKVLFVLVTSSPRDADANVARVDAARRNFVDLFEGATGHRASVDTLFAAPLIHRRAARP